MIDWGKIVESLKLPPRYVFALALAGALVLFLPDTFVNRIGLLTFRQRFLPFIGAITLLSSTLLVAHAGAFIVDWLKRRINLRAMQKSLKSLTAGEKDALRPFILDGENTRDFAVNDGVAGGLHARHILFPSSNAGYAMMFPYNLQPWARDYLKKHPKLIK